MAENSTNKDKKDKPKRNKKTDKDGVPYDTRKGDYSKIDEVFKTDEKVLCTWLTPHRCIIELFLLNRDRGAGRRFRYPPSLILYMLLLKEDLCLSYRRIQSHMSTLMELLGLPVPCFSTLHHAEERFLVDGLGVKVMEEAGRILKDAGVEEILDPLMLIGTGICPVYKAPQKIPESEKDVQEQEARDEIARQLSRSMEVKAVRDAVDAGIPRAAALDGSGEGIEGPGIYFEHIWKFHDRRFVKMHLLMDVDTHEPLVFSVTLESPGDSAMLEPILKGAKAAGLEVRVLYADMAYDSKANWAVADGNGTDFNPNLNPRFDSDRDAPGRAEKRTAEADLGKSEYHRATGYNRRWLIEAFFSMMKKMYGEKIRARLFSRMAATIGRIMCLAYFHKHRYAEARGYSSRFGQMSIEA